jgi:hypothetical protein
MKVEVGQVWNVELLNTKVLPAEVVAVDRAHAILRWKHNGNNFHAPLVELGSRIGQFLDPIIYSLVSPPANADAIPEGWEKVSKEDDTDGYWCNVCCKLALFARNDLPNSRGHVGHWGACCVEHARAQWSPEHARAQYTPEDKAMYPFTETTLDPMLAGLSQTTGPGKVVSEKITAAHERFACKENPETLHVDRNFYTQLADKCGELEAQLSVAVDHAETISLKYDRLRSFVHSKTIAQFDAIEKKRGAK